MRGWVGACGMGWLVGWLIRCHHLKVSLNCHLSFFWRGGGGHLQHCQQETDIAHNFYSFGFL